MAKEQQEHWEVTGTAHSGLQLIDTFKKYANATVKSHNGKKQHLTQVLACFDWKW